MINWGIRAIRVVAINPKTPYVGIKAKLRMIPKIVFRTPSFRLISVLPWPFMRFPLLRCPNAVKR